MKSTKNVWFLVASLAALVFAPACSGESFSSSGPDTLGSGGDPSGASAGALKGGDSGRSGSGGEPSEIGGHGGTPGLAVAGVGGDAGSSGNAGSGGYSGDGSSGSSGASGGASGSGGAGGESGSSSAAGTGGSGGTTCVAQPCPASYCGVVSDSCGGDAVCTTKCYGLWGAEEPSLCGQDDPNKCAPCEPLDDEEACEAAGAVCGSVPNGCDGFVNTSCDSYFLDQKTCPAHSSCGESGQCDGGCARADQNSCGDEGAPGITKPFEYECPPDSDEPSVGVSGEECFESSTPDVWCCNVNAYFCKFSYNSCAGADALHPHGYDCSGHPAAPEETFTLDPSKCVKTSDFNYCCSDDDVG